MRKAVIILIVLLLPGAALADNLGVFSDIPGTSCEITDGVVGLLPVYILHVNNSGSTASSFAATVPGCFTGNHLSSASEFAVSVGDVQTGISIAYGACLNVSTHVATVNLFGSGTTPACCVYSTSTNPVNASGQIEKVDCGAALLVAGGGSAIFNPDATCNCSTPTEESTWGGIKATFE